MRPPIAPPETGGGTSTFPNRRRRGTGSQRPGKGTDEGEIEDNPGGTTESSRADGSGREIVQNIDQNMIILALIIGIAYLILLTHTILL